VYHQILRWVLPLLLLAAILFVWLDHRRRAAAGRESPHHAVHHPRSHVTAAGTLACLLIVSFIVSFLIP
jgi:cytochrome c-type biogenesis protein CcmH/NrfF